MIKLLRSSLIALLLMQTVQAVGATSLTDQLNRRNQLFLATQAIHPYLFDDDVKNRLQVWLQNPKNSAYVVDCQFHLRRFFRSEKIIGPLCYLLRQNDNVRRRQSLDLVHRYVWEVQSALAELSYDPRYENADQAKAQSWHQVFASVSMNQVDACFGAALQARYPDDGSLPFTPFRSVTRCFDDTLPKVDGVPFFAVNIASAFAHHPGHAINPVGWVPGNKVEYFTYNNVSLESAQALQERFGLVTRNYPLNGAGSVDAFMRKSVNEVFTEQEGFLPIAQDPTWQQDRAHPRAIFPALLAGVDAARESLFVDIFFLGGTMGVSFAKHLIATAERGVKVFVLRDNVNHFGHEKEMRPVFNFLYAYAYKNPEKMMIVGSHIKAHRSGLPRMLSNVIDDEFLENSGLQEHLSLYGRAVSDHSKVFVVDGKSSAPIAFVGSKNLTDASGAIVYDEVARVDGPVAAVVLDDFYYDMVFALSREMEASHLTHFAKNGWSKALYRPGQSKEEMVANILRPFDLLDRDKTGRGGRSVSVPEKGTTWVRTGYNNVDSSRTNALDQVIQLIKAAKQRIYVKDQYLFDRNVVLALIRAKQQRPSLDIKILLEPLNRARPKGLPNLLYLDLLRNAGIEVKWKVLIEGVPDIHQEFHMKTISADGQFLITGSANKDQTTMYGSFREEQLDIWDAAATKIHDEELLAFWNDPEASIPFQGFAFQVPEYVRGFHGKPMSADEFVILLRNVLSLLYDTTRI